MKTYRIFLPKIFAGALTFAILILLSSIAMASEPTSVQAVAQITPPPLTPPIGPTGVPTLPIPTLPPTHTPGLPTPAPVQPTPGPGLPTPPVPIVPPPAPPTGILGYHTVRQGETLFCIGRAYGVSPWAIASQNGLSYPYRLQVGQVLAIPNVPWTNPPQGPVCSRQFGGGTNPSPQPQPSPSGCRATYVVQRGDTLFSIARRYGTTAWAIAVANNISNPNLIFVGQTLCIP